MLPAVDCNILQITLGVYVPIYYTRLLPLKIYMYFLCRERNYFVAGFLPLMDNELVWFEATPRCKLSTLYSARRTVRKSKDVLDWHHGSHTRLSDRSVWIVIALRSFIWTHHMVDHELWMIWICRCNVNVWSLPQLILILTRLFSWGCKKTLKFYQEISFYLPPLTQ